MGYHAGKPIKSVVSCLKIPVRVTGSYTVNGPAYLSISALELTSLLLLNNKKKCHEDIAVLGQFCAEVII